MQYGFGLTEKTEHWKGKLQMNDRDQRRYQRALRVQTFGDDYTADFANLNIATTEFANLDDLIDKLDDAKAGQTPNRVSKSTLVDSLKLDLQNIARTARSIEQRDNNNGFAAAYRLPDNPAERAITTHADAVLTLLEDQPADSAAVKTAKAALRGKFTSYGVPADFVTHLRADRDAIADATKHNQSENLDGVENTELISQLLNQVNDSITHLDTIANNIYSRQPEKMRAWMSASHVERAPQREKKTSPTPPPTS